MRTAGAHPSAFLRLMLISTGYATAVKPYRNYGLFLSVLDPNQEFRANALSP
jgi:hypothetical protein